jgi:hypothetical protein
MRSFVVALPSGVRVPLEGLGLAGGNETLPLDVRLSFPPALVRDDGDPIW